MFDRRTLMAIVVVMVVLMLLPYYYKWVSPQKPQTTPPVTEQPKTATDTAKTAVKPTETTPVATQTPSATATPSFFVDTIAVNADYVDIVTDLFEMKIGSNAQVSEYNLKKYHITKGTPVTLHRDASDNQVAVGYVDFDFGRYNANSIKNKYFSADKRRLNVQSGSDSVTFFAKDETGKELKLTYVVTAGKYGFELSLHTAGLAVPEIGEFKCNWMGGVPLTEPDPTRDLQYVGSYAKVGDETEKVTVGKDGHKEFSATGQSYFVAARSKYFLAAVIPMAPASGVDIVGRLETMGSKVAPHLYDLSLRTPWKGNAEGRWSIYWGPLKYNNLKASGVGLEGTMNWGWQIIKPFSLAALWLLTELGKVIPNYGVVIVLFSILVKLVLWPLTRKSQISMKKMSALQPEIQLLREKHAKNAAAMNAEIMKLYKERGVNPMSGCIPIVLQMPLLYALFIIFSTTIEFRQAPFMLWITDLSMPDVIFNLPFSIPMYGAHVAILPLIMGVTQFIMSKRTTTDPNQKMMVYIMPVFMTLIFNNFPSGLTLYYTLFNTLAIVEQNLIKVPDFTTSAVVIEEKKSKKKS